MFLNQSFKSSVMLNRYCFKQSVPILRTSTFFSIRRKPQKVEKSEFKLLYNFPFIRFTTAIIASGKTNIFLSIAACPFVYHYYGNVIPCLVVLGGASIHLILTLGFANVFKNIVGKIYVNKEGEVNDVIFSFSDKFGRRIDRIHKANELINCEYHTKFTGQLGFIQISVQNTDLHYKVNLRNCKIYEPLIWENLFGKTIYPELMRKKTVKQLK